MEPEKIVEDMLTDVISRSECFDVAIDRGLGQRQHIEKWILVEMLVRLMKLKDDGKVDDAQGEHKYGYPKSSKSKRKERADFWWIADGNEHFLEVKTIMMPDNPRKILSNDRWSPLKKDLEKIGRLPDDAIFHHLVMFFPLEEKKFGDLEKEVKNHYDIKSNELEKRLERKGYWKKIEFSYKRLYNISLKGDAKLYIALSTMIKNKNDSDIKFMRK